MENSKNKAAVVKQVKAKVSSKKPIVEVATPKTEDKPKKTTKEKVIKEEIEETPFEEFVEAFCEQGVPAVEASEIKPTHDVTVGRRLQVQHYLDLGITSPTQISKLTGCNLSYVARLKK